ncbi:ArsR/SmtB family transcription factor [Arthrobacter sp. KK5.5]|uniref:ArsR/SmtB family transcription factor n=1 Tax=Arthrobacter sp. KK5.5 TaxID=3373084 RepID=UPI003EE4A4C3
MAQTGALAVHEDVAGTVAGLGGAVVAGAAGATAGACCVPAVGQPPLGSLEADSLAARFKALADPNRLRILSIVSSSAGAESCVCDISEPLDLGQSTVSHHLKILVDAGILTREKRGVWSYYSLVPGALDGIAAALTRKV